jgi:phage tail sheath protein FI
MAYKTPGVYIEEITTLPPSVAAVETAIPAFIGYTEKSTDVDGSDLRFIPTRITSLLEFQSRFGGNFVPSTYQVVLNTNAGNTIGTVSPRNSANNERRYYLSESLRHYYANGGGPCYIVSVGSYADEPSLGDGTTPTGLLGGLSRIEPLDEPTLLVFPDGALLKNAGDLGALQKAALAQCEKLQDRFVIMDLRQGNLPVSLDGNPIKNFREEVGDNSLKYGAAYYPWVHTIYRPEVHFRQLALVNTATPPVAISPATILTGDAAIDALVPAIRDADSTVEKIVDAVKTTMGTSPPTLNRANFARLSDHFAVLLNQLRQTPVDATDATIREKFGGLLLLPRAIALAFRKLEQGTPPLPTTLRLSLTALSQDTELRNTIIELIAYEKNPGVLSSVSATRTAAEVAADYASLNDSSWIKPHPNVGAIAASTDAFNGANIRAKALNAATALPRRFDKLAAAIVSLFSAAEFLATEADKQLFGKHPVFHDIAEQVARTMTLLPASGAVAGVYAAVDRTRGVWKAPANVSLADVSGPAVKINDQIQEDLNVTSTGKSVNAIRSFTGKGTLIWGARTLASNDNEWRYIPVRRFFNMAEESIKKATEPFIFEPNDQGTWVRVRAMIENFLTVQWRQGALAGAVPQQAFFVKVGLGETMTAQDILEGRMIVEVGMAVVRPAEFIILRFAHKMQTS